MYAMQWGRTKILSGLAFSTLYSSVWVFWTILSPLLSPLNRCQEKSSRLGQDGKNKTLVNQSVDKDESVGNDKKKNSLFHLIKFYVRPMPFFPTTCLHNKLAIYQSLLGTVVIETHMLIKIMHFEDRIYGFLIWPLSLTYLEFPGGSVVKNLPANAGQIWLLGQEKALEKEMTTHSIILAWEIT